MTKVQEPIVALEGPCCAGKTTLGHGLLDALDDLTVGYVEDYSDFAGGGLFLPPPVPYSLTEEQQTLRVFLKIEQDRYTAEHSKSLDMVLVDRSVHTLLAHCNALELMTGVGYSGVAQSVLASSAIPLWPALILYLDVPEQVVIDRNMGKFADGSIFINPEFNGGVRSYFEGLSARMSPRVVWLDARMDSSELRNLAEAEVRQLLKQHRK